ncbi:MAG: hypothetical protein ACTSU9_15180 [Promethearchaeota archaeon]
MWGRTLEHEVAGKYYAIRPGTGGRGITMNGIPISPENVYHHEARVDARKGERHAFLIEHPMAVMVMNGIHDAAIQGTRTDWDFYRPADRESFAWGDTPAAVLGPADATIGRDLLGKIREEDIIDSDSPLTLKSVSSPVRLERGGMNRISIEPCTGSEPRLEISITLLGLGPIHAVLHPRDGLLDGNGSWEIRNRVLVARSAALVGLTREALLHSLGDLCGDIAGTGGINSGKINAQLGFSYHKITIGLVKHLYAEKLVHVIRD